MGKKSQKNGAFLVQGAILAGAGILTKIIGVIYRIPMINIMGDEGQAYYGVAFEIYAIALLLTSYSLPLAVSKLVAARVTKGERRNAYKVFKAALIFATASGLIVGLIVFFGADFIADKIMATPQSAYALRVLAPGLFVVAIMGVVRGYFQGLGTMLPSAVSQILEQVVNAVVSVLGASLLFQYGKKAYELKKGTDLSSAYAAAGGTMGTVLGAVAGLLFLLFVYAVYKKTIRRQIKRDRSKKRESYGSIFPILIMTIVPVILSTSIYQCSKVLDAGIFKNIMDIQGMDAVKADRLWGMYTGKYNTLCNVPLAIANAIGASVIPSLTAAVAKGNRKLVHNRIQLATRFSMIVAIPSTVGFIVLAKPIMDLLFSNGSNETPAMILRAGAVTVALYSLSTITNAILQGVNRMTTPIKHAAVSLGLHLLTLYLMLVVLKWNIYAVIVSTIVFSATMCILNQKALRREIGYVQEKYKTFIIPLIASIIMGIVSFVLQPVFSIFMPGKLATVLTLLIAVIVYGVSLLILGGLTEDEILMMPKGATLVDVFKRLHLLKEEYY